MKRRRAKPLCFRIAVDLERIQQVVDVQEGLITALKSIGKLLYANRSPEEINRDTKGKCGIILETVLQKEILCDYFNFDPAGVEKLDLATLQPSVKTCTQGQHSQQRFYSVAKPTASPTAKAPATSANSAASKPTSTVQPAAPATPKEEPTKARPSTMPRRRLPNSRCAFPSTSCTNCSNGLARWSWLVTS